MSRARLNQRDVLKDADTSNMADLTVPWRIFTAFVVPNWFLCIDAAKDYTRRLLYDCGIPPRKFYSTPMWLMNVHHWYQFLDFLNTVDLYIPSVVPRVILEKISIRQSIWAVV